MKVKSVNDVLKQNANAINNLHKGKGSVQNALLELYKTIAQHGDWTIANKALSSWEFEDMRGLDHDRDAWIKHIVAYGGLKFDEESFEFNGWSGAQHLKDNFQKAKDNPYWKSIPESKVFEFGMIDKLEGLLVQGNNAMKKATKLEKEGKEANVSVPEGIMDDIRTLIANYKAAVSQ